MWLRIRKIVGRTILVLAIISFTGILAVQAPYVQEKLGKRVARFLSQRTHTVVKIGSLRIKGLRSLKLEEIYIEDQQHDTLLHLKSIDVDIKHLLWRRNTYAFRSITMNEPSFYMVKHLNDTLYNYQFFFDSLSSGDSPESASRLKLSFEDVSITKGHFRLKDHNKIDDKQRLNFFDLDVYPIHLDLQHARIIDDSISFSIRNLQCKDQGGLSIDSILTRGYVSSSGMHLEPFLLKMNHSELVLSHLKFKHKSWESYGDFTNRVQMLISIVRGKIRMDDVGYFADQLQGWNQDFDISGLISGRVNNLSGSEVEIKTESQTVFNGDFNMDGLPDIKRTFITLRAKEMKTIASDLRRFPTFPFYAGKTLDIPDQLDALEEIGFQGEFTGFLNDFVAFGTFSSSQGKLLSDVSFKQGVHDSVLVNGRFRTQNFFLNKILDNSQFGLMNSDFSVSLLLHNGTFQKATLDGEIMAFDFNRYRYKNISLDGNVSPDRYAGSLKIDDPALLFEFDGKIELSDERKDLDFKANLFHADLGTMGLLPIEKFSSLSSGFAWDASGYSYEDLSGEIFLNQLEYCTDDTVFSFGDIYLETDTIGGIKSLNLVSDQINASLRGEYKFSEIWDDLKLAIHQKVNLFSDSFEHVFSGQGFTIEVDVNDLDFLSELDILDVKIAPGTRIDGAFYPTKDEVYVNILSDYIRYKDFTITYPEVYADLDENDMFTELLLDGLIFKESEASLSNSVFLLQAAKDTALLKLDWRRNDQRFGQGELIAVFDGMDSIDVYTKNILFSAFDVDWRISNKAHYAYRHGNSSFQQIGLRSKDQELILDGLISESNTDSLTISVNNFDLSNFNYFLNQLDYSIGGISNGTFIWEKKEDLYRLEANLKIDSALINDHFLGDIALKSFRTNLDTAYQVELVLLNQQLENLKLSGTFGLDKSYGNRINLDAKFDLLDLKFLNSLKIPGISKVNGFGTGLVGITGSINKPELDGSLDIKEGSVLIDMLGSQIYFDTRIDITKDYIALDPFYLRDNRDNRALAYGTILHQHLKDWNFNLDVEMENFESLNLIKKDESIYYGKAYATGNFNISGYDDKLFVVVNASTEPNTVITIPIGGNSSVERQDFVKFVNYNSDLKQLEEYIKKKKVKGLDMELNIQVTPDATIVMEFDEITGDVLSVKAQGLITLALNDEGDFTMKGTLVTQSGEYLFSMESIINKRFNIQRGSRITWFGDPYDARIDIKAIYKTRAALYPIMTVTPERYRHRVNVEVGLFLTEQLMTPNIAFDIVLPDSEEPERAALKNATITTQDLNLQAASLMLFGNFQPLSGSGTDGNFAAINTYEMLSNQMSNMLSGISDNVDINVNYRPETATSGQEFEVGFSTRVLDERLSISTDFGVRDNSIYGSENVNDLVGDFSAEYELTEKGNVRLKVFNQSNDYQSTAVLKQAPYTQGVGIVFRKDFDSNYRGKPDNPEELQEKLDRKAPGEKGDEQEVAPETHFIEPGNEDN
jgi:hypothetical protein